MVHLMLVQFFLEYVQIVGGGHSNDVVQRMPGSVEDLLVKVQTVYTDFILFALSTCAYFARFQHRSRFAVLPRCLKSHILPVASVKHPEEVVVGAGHNNTEERQGVSERVPSFVSSVMFS